MQTLHRLPSDYLPQTPAHQSQSPYNRRRRDGAALAAAVSMIRRRFSSLGKVSILALVAFCPAFASAATTPRIADLQCNRLNGQLEISEGIRLSRSLIRNIITREKQIPRSSESRILARFRLAVEECARTKSMLRETPDRGRIVDGLILSYRFRDTQPSVVHDDSGFGQPLDGAYDSTKVRPVTPAPGLEFLFSDSRVASTTQASKITSIIRQQNTFTIETWVKPRQTTSKLPRPLISFGSGARSNQLGFNLSQVGTRARMILRNDGRLSSFEFPGVFAARTLQHLVISYDGLALRLFVNGQQLGVRSLPAVRLDLPLGSVMVVANDLAKKSAFTGSIHLVALYERALSSREILNNFNSGLTLYYSSSSSSSSEGANDSSSSMISGSADSAHSTSSQASSSGNSLSSSSSSTSSATGGPVINIRLQPSRTSCVAPCGVYFDASNTTASSTVLPFQELNYQWDFGDPTASFRTKPNVNANRAAGGVTGHVFVSPGIYRVNLTVNDFQGNVSTASTEITVADPEVVFSPANGGYTWCVSANGDFSGCPTSDPKFHLTDYTSIFEYATLCLGLGNLGDFYPPLGPRRVLLKRGQTYVGSNRHGACLPYTEGRYDSFPIMLGAFGQGTDPVVQAPRTGQAIAPGYIFGTYAGPRAGTIISGISFKGLYDASTGLGEATGACLQLWGDSLHNSTIYRNSFSGCELNIDLRSDDPSYMVVADNVSTNWHNFGIFGNIPYGVVLANSIEQNPDTLSVNWDGKDGWCRNGGWCTADFPDHGAGRFGASTHAVICHNNLTSRNSWIGLGAQPSLRFGSEGRHDVTNAIICNNRLLPGAGSGGDSNGIQDPAGNVTDLIWEGNLVVLQHGDYFGSCFGTAFGGTTYRNNVCLKLPTNVEFPLFGSSGALQSMFTVTNPGPLNESTIALPNRYYNNALISLDEKPNYQPDYDPAFLDIYAGGYTPTATPYRFDLKNNIVKAPQLANFVSYWFFNHAAAQPPTGYPAVISADRNFFAVNQYRTYRDPFFNYPWDFWGPSGRSSNTTEDPKFAGFPTVCRPALTKKLDIVGANLTGDGVRSHVTQTGANFGGRKVLRNSRITVSRSSGGPASVLGGADYGGLWGLNVYDSIGDTIVLAHDIRVDRTNPLQIDLRVEYSPSTTSKVYVFDNSVFSVGNRISYDLESTPRTVTSVGSDGEGQFITISPTLPDRATSFVCKWGDNVIPGLNLHLDQFSPGRDSGYAVPVFEDFNQNTRPVGLGWDVGPVED